jgi:hypothetical protein
MWETRLLQEPCQFPFSDNGGRWLSKCFWKWLARSKLNAMTLLRLALILTFPVLLPAQATTAAAGDPSASNAAVASTTGTSPAGPVYTPVTPAQKAKYRALRLVEPLTLFSSAFGASIDQLRNVPKEWGQGTEGYAYRFASAEGFAAAHNAIGLGFDVAFHLDSRYHRMPQGRFKARVWNAVSQTFIADRDGGGKAFNISELAGNFGAGFVSNTWQPEPYSSTGDALTRGALGLAYHSLKNVLREFLPDILHRGSNRASSAAGQHS